MPHVLAKYFAFLVPHHKGLQYYFSIINYFFISMGFL